MVAPPEPDAIHLMIGPPQNRDIFVLQIFQIDGYFVHLFFPLLDNGREICTKQVPYAVRWPVFHGPYIVPVATVAFSGKTAMPHQRNNMTFLSGIYFYILFILIIFNYLDMYINMNVPNHIERRCCE